MKALVTFLVIVFIFAVALALGVRNEQMVQFNYLIAQDEFHLSILLGLMFSLGLLMGWLTLGYWFLRIKLTNLSLQRKLLRQGKELEELRTMPVKD